MRYLVVEKGYPYPVLLKTNDVKEALLTAKQHGNAWVRDEKTRLFVREKS